MAVVKKNNSGISINLGISSAFIILVIFTTICLCAFVFIFLRSIMRDDLRKQMHNTVGVGSLLIDGDDHYSLVSPDQETSAAYKKIQKSLQEIRAMSLDIQYVYTMRKNSDGKFIFVVDAEDDEEEKSHIGEVYDDPTPTMFEVFEAGDKVMVEYDFATDQWGTWLSGFAPIYKSDGTMDGILGIDMSAQKIVENEMTSLLVLLAVAAGVSLLVVIISIGVSRRITMPLRVLEGDMASITKFQINEDVRIKSAFKEILSMNGAIINMKASLRSFKKYVPADLVAELITLNKEARLGAEKRELTIYFSDIQGFTTFSEKLPPDQLIEAMARYFSGMTSIIMKNRGTVDKYIGDAIMAFWGAPGELDDHAFYACKSAIECRDFLNDFNREQEAAGKPPLFTRIGINTGEVLVGNIGFDQRLNYTVMGDPVNLASRLESVNKMYKTHLLISETTYNLVKDRILARIMDRVVVKGKTKSIGIYELVAISETAGQAERSFVETATAAFEQYLSRNWKQAVAMYDKVLSMRPDDYPSQMLKARCVKFMEQPPADSWTGAVILHEK
ncbi:MAG: adenylate/guanylate cyclase domain-containing protein [Spirochaetales bacterium]|nr:adenylate/guanylate cyclase domain-containing protein [Spirochaetales bacterium]